MDIRSWQHYRRFLGAISFLCHHDKVYPCADPGNFRRVWLCVCVCGGGGGVQARLTEKSSDVNFFLLFFVSPQLCRGSPVIMAFSKKTIIKL